MSLEHMLQDEQELWRLLLEEGEFSMNHSFDYAGFFTTWHKADKQYGINQEEATDKVEVAIGQGKTATFYREAGELLLESEESAFYLDAEETYRLLALLQAELKGIVQ
jgi:hypothetical protein